MTTRRKFLKTSATFTAFGILSSGFLVGNNVKADSQNKVGGQKNGSADGSFKSGKSDRSKGGIRIGGPLFCSESDPELWAKTAHDQGYRAVYAPKIKISETDRIKEFRAALKKYDLVVAEVGRWCNLMDLNEKKRQENLQKVTDGLALADELDARCCVDTAGTLTDESWYGPHPKDLSKEYLDYTVENARKIIDAVKPKRAKFAYEAMGWCLPDGPDTYLEMIQAVDRKEFGAHLDVCNMINSPRRFYNITGLINECFDTLAPWIVSCHAKDLRWELELNIHFVECVVGTGKMDYPTFLKRLYGLNRDVPLMTEHMKNQKEYEACRDYLFKTADENGIPR